MIEVIDNAFPQDVFKNLKYSICDDYLNFPWYYCLGTAFYDPTNKEPSSFAHIIISEGRDNSPLTGLIRQGFRHVIENYTTIDYKDVEICRARLGMILPKDNYHVNQPHVDFPFEHKTALLYIHALDGKTYFYDCKYPISDDWSVNAVDHFKENNKGTIKTVEPKENRMALFDGEIYHSSSSPSIDRRIALNVNFTIGK